MNKLVSTLALSLAALAAANANAGARNLVTNGDFEQTSLTASGALTNSDLTGWNVKLSGYLSGGPYNYTALYFSGNEATTTGATGTSKPDNANWILAQAADGGWGSKFIAIDGDSALTASINQNITGLTIGNTYSLYFQMAGAQDIDRTGPTTDSWRVTFGDQTQTSTVLSNTTHGFTGWVDQSMTFTATSTSQLLTFLAVGTPTGLPPISLLDGVSLIDITAAVPEPETWALMLAGLGAIGMLARKRRATR